MKKWTPITWCGPVVAMPSLMTGRDEVLEARTASSRATIRSSSVKSPAFTFSSSVAASTTRSRSASSPRSGVTRSRSRAASRSVAVSFPRRTPRSSEAVIRARPAAAAAGLTSWTTTSSPQRAVAGAGRQDQVGVRDAHAGAGDDGCAPSSTTAAAGTAVKAPRGDLLEV
ncbi:hypothetical protein AQJ64_24780 [Streptomyces griseoruber]|uniref:Uncharacterized protein n=1 Tax=Streptomyces griseoruber TaxID=1943 RepID=A0A101SV74_9ACTN|nr:hypothetical protein AQJ64_24780 [Streptomyces griseoruber]